MEISIITRDQFNHSIQLLSKSPYVKENLDLVNNLLNYDRNVSLLSLLYTCFEQFNSLSNTIFQQCQDYLANRSDNAPAFGRIFRYVSQRATGKGTGAVGSPYLPHRVPNIMFEDYFSCIMELSNVIVFLLREYSLRGDIFTIYLTEQTKNFSEIRKFQYLYYEPLLQVDSTMFYDGEKSAFSSLCNSFLYSWGKILHAFFIDGVNHLIESIRVDNVHFQSTMDYVFDLLTDLLQFPREEFHLGSYRKSKFCDEIYLRLVTTLGTAHPNRLRELLKRWFAYQPSQPSEQPILYFLKTLKVAFNQLLLNGIEVLDFLTKSKITQLNVHSSKIQEEVKNLLKNIINHTSFTLDVGQQLMNDCFSDKRLEITSKKSHIYLFEPYEIPSEIYIHIFRLILKNGFVEEFNANAVVEEIVIYFNSVNSNKDYFFFEFLKVLNKDEEQKLLVEKNNSNQVNEIVLQLVKKLLFYYLEQQCWEPLLKIFEVLSGVLQSNKHSRNNGIKLWLSQEKDLLINIPIFLMNHQKNMTVWQLNSFRLNYPFDLIDFQILFELPDNSLKKLKIFQFMNFFSTDDSRTKSSYIQPKIELLFYIFHHFEGYQGITPTTLLLCREEESPNNRNEGFEELTDLLKEMKIEEKNDDSLDAWLIKYLQSFYSPSNHCDDIIFNKFKEYCSLTWFYSLKKRVLTIIKTVCYEEKTKNALRELIIIENYKNEIEKININTFPVLFYSFLSYRRNEVEDKFICFLYFYLMKVKKPFLIFYDKETLNINQLNFQENLINNIICSKYFIPIISINTIRAIREEQSHHDLYEDNVLLEWITAINCLLLQEKYCQKHEEYSNSIPCRIIYPIFYQNDSHIDLFQSTDYQNILQSTIIPKKTLQMAKNIIEKKYKLPFLLDEKNLTISEIMNDIIKKAGFVLKYYDYSSLQQLFEKFENPQFFT